LGGQILVLLNRFSATGKPHYCKEASRQCVKDRSFDFHSVGLVFRFHTTLGRLW